MWTQATAPSGGPSTNLTEFPEWLMAWLEMGIIASRYARQPTTTGKKGLHRFTTTAFQNGKRQLPRTGTESQI